MSPRHEGADGRQEGHLTSKDESADDAMMSRTNQKASAAANQVNLTVRM